MGIFDDKLKEGNKYSSGGGKFFALQEGSNKIRIVSPLEAFGQHYDPTDKYTVCKSKEDGCPKCESDDANISKVSAYFFCYVIDRADGKIKEFSMSYTLFATINDMTDMDEYKFEPIVSGVFPYDIIIRVIEGEGKAKRKYNILPQAVVPLTEAETMEIGKLESPIKVVARMKGKELYSDSQLPTPTEDIKVEDIPF